MDLFGADDEIPEDDDAPVVAEPATAEFGHPRAASFFIGHENIERRLIEMINNNSLPHGLIFSGPKGVGKSTLAFRLARALFKRGAFDPNQDSLFGAPEPSTMTTLDIPAQDIVFTRVASGGHPDLLTIERAYDATKDKYKAGVDVEEIRKVAPFLRKTASDGGWRVVIIDDADTMNRNAQNALLKILEEPPANALIVLVTHRAGALIPTIRSRTQTIHFDALAADTMKQLLEHMGERIGSEDLIMLDSLAQGSFGKARQILESEGLPMVKRILDLLENYPDTDRAQIHKFADSTGLSEDSYELVSEIMPAIFRQLARAKARGQGITGYGVHKPLMETMLTLSSLEQLMKAGDALQGHYTKVNIGNLDKRQGILTSFSLIVN